MFNLHTIDQTFTCQQDCISYLENIRWGNTPACVVCGCLNPYKLTKRNGYKCKECKKFFNVLTGTIFENTKIPLVKWFKAILIFTSHKKGISSIQLGKDLGISQPCAWFVLSRVRELIKNKGSFMLKGTIEVDESYFGGKEKNRHQSVRAKAKRLEQRDGKIIKGGADKTMVFGLLERDGNVVNVVVPNANSENLLPIIQQQVAEGSTMVSDDYLAYRSVTKLGFKHEYVNHSIKEYVNGIAHTQNLDGYWSHLKRGLYGIYHHCNPKHLHRYCNEFSFRYNTRKSNEVERFDKALGQCEKSRLRYSELTKKV